MKLSVTEARKRFAHVLLAIKKGPVYIENHGKPTGVLLHPDTYQNMQDTIERLKGAESAWRASLRHVNTEKQEQTADGQ